MSAVTSSSLAPTPVQVGFYGKLPSNGDFLRRRASDEFIERWDGWLQECMAASRSSLGDRWLDVYLTSPAWRFVCDAGPCGPTPVAGLMVPSVDSVGRYFPLTVVAELPPDVNLIAVSKASSFFENAERLVIETLEADYVDFDRFDQHVSQLGYELLALNAPPPLALARDAAAVLTGDGQTAWQVPLGSATLLAPALDHLLSRGLAALYEPLAMWWTEGSAVVEPSCLIGRGLPRPDSFASLMDGSWADRQWRSVPAEIAQSDEVESVSVFDGLLEAQSVWGFSSAGASDVGRIRQINQDSFLERPEIGLWAVADGLGGHRDGEIASRMLCDALADFEPAGSMEDMVQRLSERIHQVNDQLQRNNERSSMSESCGSTIVLLFARGDACVMIWAGDSRAYRWRDGRLERMTRDHSMAELDAEGHSGSTAITRAVGVEATVTLDVRRDQVRPGDRYLLCSDGLHHTIGDDQIQAWMDAADVRSAVNGLMQTTLDAGAPDNVTIVIAEARG